MGEAALKQVEKTWFTTREAAEYLCISSDALHKHVQRGKIRPASAATLGRRFGLRFKKDALDAFITGETNGGQG